MFDVDDFGMSILYTKWWSTAHPDPVFPTDFPTGDLRPLPWCHNDYEEDDDDGSVLC